LPKLKFIKYISGEHFRSILSRMKIEIKTETAILRQKANTEVTTERKKVENALKETNNKLIQAQRVAKIGSWENSLTTNDLQWSEEMYHILGFPINTSINLAEASRIFPPEEILHFQEAVSNAINKDAPYSIDYKIVRIDGSVRYIHDEGEIIRDEHGQAIRMFGTTQDITERKLAEDKLHQVTRLFMLLSQINQAIVRVKEQDELFRKICQVAIEFGQFRMAWIGLFDEADNSLKPVTHAGHEDGYLDQVSISVGNMPTGQGPTGLAFQGGQVMTSFEIATDPRMIPWRDEALERGYLSSAAVPFRRKGKTVGTLTLFAKDLGFFTIDEQELLQEIGVDISFALDSMASETESKLAEKQIAKLSNAVEQSADIVFITDREGIIEYLNPAFETITGYNKAEALGNTPRILKSGLMDLQYYQRVWTTILSGKVLRGEVINRTKNGDIFFYDQTITPLIGVDGKVTHFISTGKDITERKRSEILLHKKNEELTQTNIELIKAKEKAEESDRLKSAFLANMSHEVRTPLNSIIGFSELLADPDLEEGQKDEFIQIIISNGNNLLTIISDIMDISKMESGEISISKSQINARKFISDIRERFVIQVEMKQLEFKLILPENDEETMIFADVERLWQIFNNLINNAIKFTNSGRIEIGYQPKGTMVEFFIRDTGIGIPAEFHDKIFERFRQVDDSKTRLYGGNGLGLAITKNLVELMGGKIRLESEPGKGSAFYFTLPVN